MFLSPYSIPGIVDFRNGKLADNRKVQIIKKVVCDLYDISDDDMHKKSRKRHVCDARHVAIYFIKNLTSAKLVDIGRMFNQDHTTVIHAVEKVKNIMETDVFFYGSVNDVLSTINKEFSNYKDKMVQINLA